MTRISKPSALLSGLVLALTITVAHPLAAQDQGGGLFSGLGKIVKSGIGAAIRGDKDAAAEAMLDEGVDQLLGGSDGQGQTQGQTQGHTNTQSSRQSSQGQPAPIDQNNPSKLEGDARTYRNAVFQNSEYQRIYDQVEKDWGWNWYEMTAAQKDAAAEEALRRYEAKVTDPNYVSADAIAREWKWDPARLSPNQRAAVQKEVNRRKSLRIASQRHRNPPQSASPAAAQSTSAQPSSQNDGLARDIVNRGIRESNMSGRQGRVAGAAADAMLTGDDAAMGEVVKDEVVNEATSRLGGGLLGGVVGNVVGRVLDGGLASSGGSSSTTAPSNRRSGSGFGNRGNR